MSRPHDMVVVHSGLISIAFGTGATRIDQGIERLTYDYEVDGSNPNDFYSTKSVDH